MNKHKYCFQAAMVSGVALASPVPLQECLKRTAVSHYVTSAAPLCYQPLGYHCLCLLLPWV